jgi:ADP-ribose pyrophosphatase
MTAERRSAAALLPRPIRKRPLFLSEFISIDEVTFRYPDGRDFCFTIRQEHDVVVCAALTADGQALMLREYRPGPGRYLYEAPAGMRARDQEPLQAMEAELLEETGYAGEVALVSASYVGAYSSAKRFLFMARNCRGVQPPAHLPGELMEIVFLGPTELDQVIAAGDTTDLDACLLLRETLARSAASRGHQP